LGILGVRLVFVLVFVLVLVLVLLLALVLVDVVLIVAAIDYFTVLFPRRLRPQPYVVVVRSLLAIVGAVVCGRRCRRWSAYVFNGTKPKCRCRDDRYTTTTLMTMTTTRRRRQRRTTVDGRR
jgi:hypothetical protein